MLKSLRAQLLFWVIIIESLVLAGAGFLQYRQKGGEFLADLERQGKAAASRLAVVLPPAIYSFEEAMISRVLQAEMDNRNVRKILIFANGKANGFHRDEEWKVTATNEADPAPANIVTKLIYGSGKNEEELGELQIFFTDRFISQALRDEMTRTVLLIVALDLIILILLSWILGKKVVLPMQSIAETLGEVSRSRNAATRLEVAGAREIQAVVAATNAMLEANQQAAMVAEELGRGNLTVDVFPVSENDTMGMAQKSMVESLTEMLSRISQVSEELNGGAEKLSVASAALSTQTSCEAASVEEISSSLADIAGRSKSNAEKTDLMRSLAVEAQDAAGRGNEQMREMVESMAMITVESGKIAKIIKVIDDIAFQTNLLSLNAAVEAARAGKHGRGFAVVADEVRNLAGRSAKAAKETADMIEITVKKITAGAEVAGKTNEGLQTIVKAINKTNDLIEEITVASKEQAQWVDQISLGIVQIQEATQKNCATAQETASSAEILNKLARDLRNLLEKFCFK